MRATLTDMVTWKKEIPWDSTPRQRTKHLRDAESRSGLPQWGTLAEPVKGFSTASEVS